jgi:hypothetical protein
MQSRFEFITGLYYPGYMGLLKEDYDGCEGIFNFKPTEPPVFRAASYLTPRGAHIFISQAGMCLVEKLIEQGMLDMDIESYRDVTSKGRLKIVELNQKYRKEIKLDNNLQGRLKLTKLRAGAIPIIKIDFDIDDRSIRGDFTGVLAPYPVPQMNADVWRG